MNLRPKWDRLNNSRYEIKEGGKNITKARKHYIFLEYPVAMLRFLKFFISLSLKCTYIANLFFFSRFLVVFLLVFSIIFGKHQFNFASIKFVKNVIGHVLLNFSRKSNHLVQFCLRHRMMQYIVLEVF